MMEIDGVRRDTIFRKFWAQRYLMLLTLPAVLWMIIFNYLPMYGIIIAFKEFNPILGILKSPLTGMANFQELFSDPTFFSALYNTIKISFAKLLICFPAPIIFALLLNELTNTKFRRLVQTFSYLPYFISWVFVVGLMYSILAPKTGIVNSFLQSMRLIKHDIMFMGEPKYFLSLVVASDLWKNLGWSSIVYLAAITGVDQQLYESAIVDGAGRFARIWYITLPSIKVTIIILLILAISGLINANFDQLFLMQNSMVQDEANVINIYAYKMGVVLGRFSYGTAVGLFQSVVSVLLLVTANYTSRRLTGESLF